MVFFLQADKPQLNSIQIFKLSNITGKRRELVPKKASDDSDMDSDSDSDEEEGEFGLKAPILQASM